MKLLGLLSGLLLLAPSTWGWGTQLPFAFGPANGDSTLMLSDDDGQTLHLPRPLPYNNSVTTQLWISTNGLVSLNGAIYVAPQKPFPGKQPLVAPFWGDAVTNSQLPGRVYYRLVEPGAANDSTTGIALAQLSANYPRYQSFRPLYSVVVTWANVSCFSCDVWHDTFAFFYYQSIQWVISPSSKYYAIAGWDAADGRNFYTIPGSNTSNVNNAVIGPGNCPGQPMGQYCSHIAFGPPPPTTTPPTTPSQTTGPSTSTTTTTPPPYDGRASECLFIKRNYPSTPDGVQAITISGTRLFVYCDMTNGGWTYIQRRVGGSQNFNQNHLAYRTGFGNASSDYWLGLNYVKSLTDSFSHQMMVNLTDCNGNTGSITYNNFALGPVPNFNLTYSGVSAMTGNIGDALNNTLNPMLPQIHHGFATNDYDTHSWYVNCGQYMERMCSGWWYNACPSLSSNLNGPYQGDCLDSVPNHGIQWNTWKNAHTSILHASMKIKAVLS